MLAQLKKNPIAAALAFVVACSVCFLPVLIAAIAVGGITSTVGSFAGSIWGVAAGIIVTAGSLAASVWLMRRHRDRCSPAPVRES